MNKSEPEKDPEQEPKFSITIEKILKNRQQMSESFQEEERIRSMSISQLLRQMDFADDARAKKANRPPN